ncbi:hypothetical protein V1264_014811 [Littorina saxatilis]|uniref:AD domain-containing protein n=2 Tax=Littorina saxatilis TaxID=31220 RepID=A0AAN9BTE9_9CAEN
MASSECSGEYFTVGAQVKFVTANSAERRGEVVAFDYNTKMLLIKRPSLGQHGMFDLEFVNLDLVRKMECTEEPGLQTQPADTLPIVPSHKLSKRIKESLFERKQQLNLVGVDVPPEGQLLMNRISKTITEVRWDKDVIVVMNVVTITPPYTTAQCQLIGKDNQPAQPTHQNQNTLSHILKIVEKHQKDETVRQSQSPNDTRRSMSPSPATSSSSTSSAS